MNDLQSKAEKYEAKAAKCKEAAETASEGPRRSMYEGLSSYYGNLAADFRQAIEKRKAA